MGINITQAELLTVGVIKCLCEENYNVKKHKLNRFILNSDLLNLLCEKKDNSYSYNGLSFKVTNLANGQCLIN